MTHIKPSDIEYKLASSRQRLEQIFGWPVPGQALPLHLSRETVQSLQGEQSLLDMEDRLVVELHTQIDGVDRAEYRRCRTEQFIQNKIENLDPSYMEQTARDLASIVVQARAIDLSIGDWLKAIALSDDFRRMVEHLHTISQAERMRILRVGPRRGNKRLCKKALKWLKRAADVESRYRYCVKYTATH